MHSKDTEISFSHDLLCNIVHNAADLLEHP